MWKKQFPATLIDHRTSETPLLLAPLPLVACNINTTSYQFMAEECMLVLKFRFSVHPCHIHTFFTFTGSQRQNFTCAVTMFCPEKEVTFQRGTVQHMMTPMSPRSPRATQVIWTPADPILKKTRLGDKTPLKNLLLQVQHSEEGDSFNDGKRNQHFSCVFQLYLSMLILLTNSFSFILLFVSTSTSVVGWASLSHLIIEWSSLILALHAKAFICYCRSTGVYLSV